MLTADACASVLPEAAAERTAWLVLRDTGRTGRHTRGGVVDGAWFRSHLSERTNALLKNYEALRRVSLDPWRIGAVVQAALVLLRLEHDRTA